MTRSCHGCGERHDDRFPFCWDCSATLAGIALVSAAVGVTVAYWLGKL